MTGPNETRPPLGRGSPVGRYLIVDTLGIGTTGVVYRAYDPELERMVALKLIRPEHVSAESAARLLREGRAIAKLAHPNVVAVYDLGRHDDQVFVAMELVAGTTLAAWLASEPRSWRAVLGVFLQAGAGLAAAHTAGIVHREFKPTNVFVGDDGRVRVRYVAPEELDAIVDAASDQLGFATCLWQALYGEPPPALPAGSAVPARVRAALTRALAGDPRERFPSLEALLAALAPPARGRRSRWIALATLALGLAVFAATQLVPSQDVCAGADDELAGVWDVPSRVELAIAFGRSGKPYAGAALSEAERGLDEYMRDWVAMKTESCRATAVRHVQTEDAQGLRDVCLSQRLGDAHALVRALAHGDADAVSRAPLAVGLLPALDACADLHALTQKQPDPLAPSARLFTAAIGNELAASDALVDLAKYRDALPLARHSADEARAANAHALAGRALALAGWIENHLGENKAAEALLADAIDEAQIASDDRTLEHAWVTLVAVVGLGQGRFDEAMSIARHASAIIERLGGDPIERARLDKHRGRIFMLRSQFGDALAAFDSSYAIETRMLRAGDLRIADTLEDLGDVYTALDRFDDAASAYQRAAALRESKLGPAHPDVGRSYAYFGDILAQRRDFAGARAQYEHALRVYDSALGPGSRAAANVYYQLAQVQESPDEQQHTLERALQIFERVSDRNSVKVTLQLLATVHARAGKYELASREIERSVQLAKDLGVASDSKIDMTRVEIYMGLKKYDLAERAAREAIAIEEARGAENRSTAAVAHGYLGRVFLEQHQYERSLPEHQLQLAIDEQLRGGDNASLASPLTNIGLALVGLGRDREALPQLTRALALDEQVYGKTSPELAVELCGIGQALDHVGRPIEAVATLERALALLDAASEPDEVRDNVQLALASALWHAGGDRARAIRLARTAHTGFGKLGLAFERDQAARWLAQRAP